MKLTREERKAVYRGERKLRRLEKPEISDGDTLIVAWSRGGKRVVDRETGELAEAVRRPTIWLKFKEPEELDGEWLVKFAIHDEREVTRMLGAGVSGYERQAGLKTRWRNPRSVPSREKQAAQMEQFTPETERGYLGGGYVIDHLEALDDGELGELRRQADQRWAEDHQAETKEQELKRLSNKARRLQREAEKAGVDLSGDLSTFIDKAREAIVAAKAVA